MRFVVEGLSGFMVRGGMWVLGSGEWGERLGVVIIYLMRGEMDEGLGVWVVGCLYIERFVKTKY